MMTIRRIAGILLPVLFLASCQFSLPSSRTSAVPPGVEEVDEIPDPLESAWGDASFYKPGLAAGATPSLALLGQASEYHIDLTLDDDLTSLRGRQAVRFTNQHSAPIDTLVLRLFPNLAGGVMQITNLKIGSTEVGGSLEAADSVFRVPLPAALEPGESLTLELAFDVSLPLEMAGNYGLFGYHDGILLLQEFHPIIPAFDAGGWAVGVPPVHGDLTHLETSFYLLRITAPDELTVVASGTTLMRSQQNGTQTLLQAAGPARDVYLAASADFDLETLEEADILYTSYVRSPDNQTVREILDVAAASLQFFEQTIAPYPYVEFELIGTPMQALGMEYPGVVALSHDLYDPDATISGLPSSVFLEGTVVHEVAHQWFYNFIGNDQVNHPWLDEALTQFVTGLYFRDRYGDAGYNQFRDSWVARWDRIDRSEVPIGLPSSAYDGRSYGAVIYGRGPLFMEQLEKVIGRETFADLLKRYAASFAWGIGTPQGFQELAEEACICDLDVLFGEWLYE